MKKALQVSLIRTWADTQLIADREVLVGRNCSWFVTLSIFWHFSKNHQVWQLECVVALHHATVLWSIPSLDLLSFFNESTNLYVFFFYKSLFFVCCPNVWSIYHVLVQCPTIIHILFICGEVYNSQHTTGFETS